MSDEAAPAPTKKVRNGLGMGSGPIAERLQINLTIQFSGGEDATTFACAEVGAHGG